VKRHVVDGDAGNMLFNRLRLKYSLLFNSYQNSFRYRYVWKRK